MFLCLLLLIKNCEPNRPVITQIKSKWKLYPFLTQTSEYFANIDHKKYWQFLNELQFHQIDPLERCSQDDYDLAVKITRKISAYSVPIVKMSLAMNDRIPKSEFYQNVAIHEKKISLDCDHYFIFNNEKICGLEDFKEILNKTEECEDTLKMDSWDRIYNDSSYNQKAPLLYYFQDIFHPQFSKIHQTMIEFSKNGLIRYIYFPITKTSCKEEATLSGYGAALKVKKTSYTTIDDLKINLFSHQIPSILTDYDQKYHNKTFFEIPDIPNNQQDLFLSLIEYLQKFESDYRFSSLVEFSQNIPLYISRLKENDGSKHTRRHLSFQNKLQNYKKTEENVIVNGQPLSDEISPFELIPIFEKEFKALESLKNLGFNADESFKILTQSINNKKTAQKLDIRSKYILWLNDIEKDKRYSDMSKSFDQILYFNFGGDVYPIRRNLANYVLFVDPLSSKFFSHLNVIFRILQSGYPLRFGLHFITNTQSRKGLAFSRSIINLINKNNLLQVLSYAQEVAEKINHIKIEELVEIYRRYDNSDAFLIPLQTHNLDTFINESNEFYNNLGISQLPTFIFNGEILDYKAIESDLISTLITAYYKQIEEIKEIVSKGKLKITTTTEDYFMGGQNYYKSLNLEILNLQPNFPIIDSVETNDCDFSKDLNKGQLYFCLIKNAIYLETKNSPKLTVWILVNPETENGLKCLKELQEIDTSLPLNIGMIFTNELTNHVSISDKILHESQDQKISIENLAKLLEKRNHDNIQISPVRERHHYLKKLFDVNSNESYIIFMNKKYGPFETKPFKLTDLSLILNKNENFKTIDVKFKNQYTIDSVFLLDIIKNILSYKTNQNFIFVPDDVHIFREFILVSSPLKEDHYIQIDLFLNPLSDDTQKWPSLLQSLSQSLNVKLRIFLIFDEYKIKSFTNRFYKYVFQGSLKFKDKKLDDMTNTAIFDPLPLNSVFTFHYETLQAWFVKSLFSNCDMDNIYLDQHELGCIGIYQLEYLMVEGHAFNSKKGQPASGLELIMGTLSNPQMYDTIVIHNLGYFQFKGDAGSFYINLKPGESAANNDIEKITSLTTGTDDKITIDNFLGQLLKITINQKTKSKEATKNETSWWGSVKSIFSGDSNSTDLNVEAKEEINIFTVATGLLYERFMRIMIMSVLEHTKTPVKFWFLKNYVSFQFTESIDVLSKKLGFKYQFVQYQWPHWLLKQTDKQRIIWGYKILFLDVLFPLDIKKIIFVDADQIVRADLNELYNIDLKGAPYAYTPFCDDRKEMDKFRFWKSGYWREHLQGKPYHISALYVVDLIKFREMMAGDRLRSQYQLLSRDPNSLANLDQDLPNNIQEIVPIKSLPIEWLWCETWCSDRSKDKAKTIDMCNNPLTYEAKLDRAKRIAPEFTKYDEIISDILSEHDKSTKINSLKDEL